MGKREIKTPFFVVNPKAYLYGEKSIKLAKVADDLSKKYDVDIFFTAQLVDIEKIKSETDNIIITVQHMDGLLPGAGMGHILGDALVNAGVEATFLNHAEHQMSLNNLVKAMKRADELGIITIVCADSVDEGKAVAQLKPDIIVCEPTELIGTGKTSDENYMKQTNDSIKEISSNTLVLQAAGISSGENVYKAIMSGADGTGGTSGIVCAKDPSAVLEEMIVSLVRSREELVCSK
ncbi:MAG: triose-phosphate isomerase [Peptostreptococcaceae bacterium]